MKFIINSKNYKGLAVLGKKLKIGIADKLKIEIDLSDPPLFSELVPYIYNLLDFEMHAGIWLINFPYCVLSEVSRDHVILRDKQSGEQLNKCKKCKYYKACAGFPIGYFEKFGKNEVAPIGDLPAEVMIEVESKCNFSCNFCYNHNSFAKQGRNIKNFSAKYVKKIIDNAVGSGIQIVRFTGGEPLLRKDIFELMKYAKGRGLEVRLNTNCYLLNKANCDKLIDIVDNFLVPIESFSKEKEAGITGKENSLKKKVDAIKVLKKNGIKVVRAGTVATRENIENFSKLADFILSLPVDEWELYRPISGTDNKYKLSASEVNKLADGIADLRKNTGKIVSIANAIPFCAIKDLNKMNYVSRGALFDDGHSRLVIDPRGFVKPHYFIDKNIGDPLDIISAWNHPFMKKIRNLEFLPEECKDCNFRFKCCGGSRHEAGIFYGRIDARDPLMK